MITESRMPGKNNPSGPVGSGFIIFAHA